MAALRRSMRIDDVRRALARPLPGLEAQARMAPPYRKSDIDKMLNPPACKQAGVLVLLYPLNGRLYFPLTRRPDSVEYHKGQISLPGGSCENGEPLCQTALRETEEEIGVAASSVELIGELSLLYVPPSNFCIHPFVGFSPRHPEFRLAEVEVAELIVAPIESLLDLATTRVEDWEIRGSVWPIPFYQFGPHKVWGATAMILAELAAMLESETHFLGENGFLPLVTKPY
jgi:8-oxo-dGTP pyrophosphatase MutT (NUDIX family)